MLYDPTRQPLVTAFRVTHTVVPSVLARIEFWLLFSLHLIFGCVYRLDFLSEDHITFFGWDDMRVTTAITTFFLVFYTKECYSRYLHCYELVRLLLGSLHDYCFELRLFLGGKGKQYVRLASRQLVASMLLFFYEMNDVSEMEWEELVDQGLLQLQERDFLQDFERCQHSMIMLQWSAEAASEGCEKTKAPVKVLMSLMRRLTYCRSLQQEVIDTVELSTPFQYVHLLKCMLLVNCCCWGWCMAMTHSIFAPLVYWFALLTFMGMMELASQLSDPFGDDEVDFPVTEWLDEFVENAVVLLEFTSPPDHLKKALASEGKLKWNHPGLRLSLVESFESRESRARDLPVQSSTESFDSSELAERDEILKPLI